MLIRKSVIEKIGLFDPDYFAYFEETDFCMRAWLPGWSVWYDRKRDLSSRRGSVRETIAPIYFHSVKNMVCTYLKNLSLFRCVTTIPQLVTFHLFGMIFFFLRGKFAISRAILSGLWWNVRYAGATYRKRQRIHLFVALPMGITCLL